MKQLWTMPSVEVEGFAANEYVAACSWEGGYLNIDCEYVDDTASAFTSPTHGYLSGSTCDQSIRVSAEQWNQFRTRGAWFGSNGTWVNTTNGNNNTPDDYQGDYVYYVYTKKRGKETWVIFSIYHWTGRDYWLSNSDGNHRVLYGKSGNPDS